MASKYGVDGYNYPSTKQINGEHSHEWGSWIVYCEWIYTLYSVELDHSDAHVQQSEHKWVSTVEIFAYTSRVPASW